MTEAEWLASDDPGRMLAALQAPDVLMAPSARNVWPSSRKLRLFACAMACKAWGHEYTLADRGGYGHWHETGEADPNDPEDDALSPMRVVRSWIEDPEGDIRPADQAHFLRDIVGNPFRVVLLPYRCRECGIPCGPPAAGYYCVRCGADETRCPWLTPAVLGLAQDAYDSRRWDLLPVLADALEEAGCGHADLLAHLRGRERCPKCLGTRFVSEEVHVPDPPYMHRMIPRFESRKTVCTACDFTGWIPLRSPHVRGCAAIDLILGKE